MKNPYHDDFMEGVLDAPGSKEKLRTPAERVAYEQGRRMSGRDRRKVRVLTSSDIAEGQTFLRFSLILGVVGAIGGAGYGAWQWVTVTGATAVEILKWAGIGAAGGALTPTAVIVGVCVAILGAILWGLGLLLNLLAG